MTRRLTFAGISIALARLAIAASTLAGCAALYPVEVESLTAESAPAREPESVELFDHVPPRPFVEIARLSTESVNYESVAHAVTRLRARAARLGADALVIEARGSRAATTRYPGISNTDADFGVGHAVPGSPRQLEYTQGYFARGIALRWSGPDPREDSGLTASRPRPPQSP